MGMIVEIKKCSKCGLDSGNNKCNKECLTPYSPKEALAVLLLNWSSKGTYFSKAWRFYQKAEKRLASLREQLLKANKEPLKYHSYRIRRKALNKIILIYMKAADDSLISFNKYKEYINEL